MADLDTLTLILLILAGLAAGWVDAVVGGGGLIQLPAMMLVPGITPVQALATNKIASVMGTSVAAVTYTRRVKTDMRTALPLAGMAFLGAIVGAVIATYIPEEAFTPILL
ncbi:MAG: sulfite exporter TauE/SafE family protein, partial [Candidatus Microbacterium stercoravium]